MAILEVEGATKRFGGLVAVDSVSFSVEKGEILGIIGPNGAGKTTLFGLISGFLPPSAGDVRFEGRSIVGTPPHLLVKDGLVRSFQIVQTFADMSTLDVVTTAALVRRPLREAIDYAALILARVGLSGKEHRLPSELSGGEQARVAIARAVVNEPPLILADEPTGNLDSGTGRAVMELLAKLNRSRRTVLVVTHDEAVARLARRVVRLFDGYVVGDSRSADADANRTPHVESLDETDQSAARSRR